MLTSLVVRRTLTISSLLATFSMAAAVSPHIVWQHNLEPGHFQAVDFSPDGSTLVHGSYRVFRTFSSKTGATLARFTSPHTYALGGLTFSPDGTKIYAANFDLALQTFSADGELLLTTLQYPWSNAAVSPDGRFLAAGIVGSGLLRTMNESDHSQVAVLQNHSGAVNWVAYSPDGSLLATTGWDGRLIVRHTGALPIIWTIQAHQAVARQLAFSPDGTRIVTGGNDGFARVWDLTTSKMVAQMHHPGVVTSVDWSSDGRAIAVATMEPSIRIYRTADFSQVVSYTGDMGEGPMRVQFSPDSGMFAYARRDGVLAMAVNPMVFMRR